MTNILDYFPEALFIDEGTDALKFIQDLQRRELLTDIPTWKFSIHIMLERMDSTSIMRS